MAMLGGVAGPAKRLAIRRIVFPRQPPANVSLVVDLKHNVIKFGRSKAAGTATTMQLYNV
jgi:hypothetical protein